MPYVANSTFTHNHAARRGGAMAVTSVTGTFAISDSVFDSNTACHGGGAIATTATAEVLVHGSLFSNQSATLASCGGALSWSGGTGGAIVHVRSCNLRAVIITCQACRAELLPWSQEPLMLPQLQHGHHASIQIYSFTHAAAWRHNTDAHESVAHSPSVWYQCCAVREQTLRAPIYCVHVFAGQRWAFAGQRLCLPAELGCSGRRHCACCRRGGHTREQHARAEYCAAAGRWAGVLAVWQRAR